MAGRKASADVPADAKVSSERLSELFGVHPKTVALWIKDGLPVASRTGRANAIELGVAIRWVRERDAARADQELEAAKSSPDLDVVRVRKLEAESRIAEAEADQIEGTLVVAADVTDHLSRVALGIREAVLNLSAQAVQAGIVPIEQEDALSDLCRDALRELTKLEPEPTVDVTARVGSDEPEVAE